MSLAYFRDLDTWSEAGGFGSTSGLVCPGCSAPLRPPADRLGGIARCGECTKRFEWEFVDSAVGPAWVTWVCKEHEALCLSETVMDMAELPRSASIAKDLRSAAPDDASVHRALSDSTIACPTDNNGKAV